MLSSTALILAAGLAGFWLLAVAVVVAVSRMAALGDAELSEARRSSAADEPASLEPALSQAAPRQHVAHGPHQDLEVAP